MTLVLRLCAGVDYVGGVTVGTTPLPVCAVTTLRCDCTVNNNPRWEQKASLLVSTEIGTCKCNGEGVKEESSFAMSRSGGKRARALALGLRSSTRPVTRYPHWSHRVTPLPLPYAPTLQVVLQSTMHLSASQSKPGSSFAWYRSRAVQKRKFTARTNRGPCSASKPDHFLAGGRRCSRIAFKEDSRISQCKQPS